MVLERSETTYTMQADGTGERENHILVRLQSQGAAQQFSVLSFAYASANEVPLIKLVRVHKPDGTTIDTPSSDAIDMGSAVTREAPLYSDLKEKHLPVRSLSPGDTLEYDVEFAINKAEAPGQFWGVDHFTAPGTAIVLAEILTLRVPADKYVQVWSPNHKPTISEHDGVRTYSWNVAQLITPRRTPLAIPVSRFRPKISMRMPTAAKYHRSPGRRSIAGPRWGTGIAALLSPRRSPTTLSAPAPTN